MDKIHRLALVENYSHMVVESFKKSYIPVCTLMTPFCAGMVHIMSLKTTFTVCCTYQLQLHSTQYLKPHFSEYSSCSDSPLDRHFRQNYYNPIISGAVLDERLPTYPWSVTLWRSPLARKADADSPRNYIFPQTANLTLMH